MTHTRVKSSSIHSLAHEGDTMEVRFLCGKCKAAGTWCHACDGKGHGPTYTYHGVPADVHGKVAGAKSVGKAFAGHVRGKFKESK